MEEDRPIQVSSLRVRDLVMVVLYVLTVGVAWGVMDNEVENVVERVDRVDTRMQTRFNSIEARLDRAIQEGGK